MPNFDFHSNLSPDEFERFARDVLEIREEPKKFRTYRRGRDGGVDLRCTNSDELIIGQARLYKNDYSQLRRSLVEEFEKVRKLDPKRYILFTSVSLTPGQTLKILSLFEGYITSEEDILDREQLNKYLGQDRYKGLLLTYSKLLVPDLSYLQQILEIELTKGISNRSRRELRLMDEGRKVFVSNVAFTKSLDFLLRNHLIILSGNPGVGKTTIGHMLCNYLLSIDSNSFEFVSVSNMEEIDRSFASDRKQIFFWDDFWGQVLADVPFDSRYKSQFTKLLDDFRGSPNHYLVITSRDYILKTNPLRTSPDLNQQIDLAKLAVRVDDLSLEEKARIFLNHLYFSVFGRDYFEYLSWGSHDLETVLKHENYSPRHVDYFINRICSEDFIREHGVNPYNFLHIFRRYLGKPNSFWEDLFNKQTPTARLILLILLISNDPMSLEDLRGSFLSLQLSIREQLNLEVLPLQFEAEIRVLEELFIRTEPSERGYGILINFQSPGIKDFLLEYLRENIESWGNPLISNAKFFNQLFFIFTISVGERIDDLDSDSPLMGKKILTSSSLQKSLKEKVLTDFHSLAFSTVVEWWNLDKVGRHTDLEDSKYWKLSSLCSCFDIRARENDDLRTFVFSEIVSDIDRFYSAGGKIVSRGSMDHFPGLVSLFKEEFSSSYDALIQAYYDSITFTGEFISLLAFKDIFPIEYEDFLSKNIGELRQKIKNLILDDISFFLSDGMDWEIDELFEFEIPEVFKSYGLRMSKKFQQEIEDVSEGEISYRKKRSVPRPKRLKSKGSSRKTKSRPSSLKRVVNEYLAESVVAPRFNYRTALKEYNLDKSIRGAIPQLKGNSGLVDSFFNDEVSFSLLVESLASARVDSTSEWAVLERVGETQISRIHESLGSCSRDEILKLVCSLALDIFLSETRTTTLKSVEKHIRNVFPAQNVEWSSLGPLITKRGNWYEFLNSGLLFFFLSKKLFDETKEQVFYDELNEIIGSDYEGSSVMRLLGQACPKRLYDQFIVPIRDEILEVLGDNSEHEVVSNFLGYFEPSFTFSFNKKLKTLGECGFQNTRVVEETIVEFLCPEFDLLSLEAFLTEGPHATDNIDATSSNPAPLKILYAQVIKCGQIEAESETNCSHPHVTLDLKEFVRETENYEALQGVGLVDYVMSAISCLRRRI